MFKFAIKNLLIKKVQVILIILSIIVSAGVGVMSYNVSNQVSDGLTNNAAYYSLIIGPSGSATQLAMNSMYFTDEPLGTIPYSIKSDLEMDSRVKSVIPFAMADNYKGYSMVGTTTEYLKGKKVAIVDDVVSTGGSLHGLEDIVKLAGGEVCNKAFVLAEGDAKNREDIIYLASIPIL